MPNREKPSSRDLFIGIGQDAAPVQIEPPAEKRIEPAIGNMQAYDPAMQPDHGDHGRC